MGLTSKSTGKNTFSGGDITQKRYDDDVKVALVGNPNVGKSTVFNALTGLNQHTGNWPGKTVCGASGHFWHNGRGCTLVDTPGCYSLKPKSAEESVTKDFIYYGNCDAVVVVCDACCLERNLILVLNIKKVNKNVIICVNMIDEAKTKGIKIDFEKLENELELKVVPISARKGIGLEKLKKVIFEITDTKNEVIIDENIDIEQNVKKSKSIVLGCVEKQKQKSSFSARIDKVITSKIFSFPIMFLLVAFVFWLTIVGANYPSEALSELLFGFEQPMYNFLINIRIPSVIADCVVFGVYRVVVWVVSVMLPPMAIFFPLFTLLEDSGFLPRFAFNVDRCFKKCNTCGKQALTMCMGFGCNAAGVVGCRIIESKKERLIAILTNSFMPCNGRFPILISIITMFFITTAGGGSLLSATYLTLLILLCVIVTLLISKLLSMILLKSEASSFILELPPYRKPQFLKVLVRSLFDRTVYVLGRAVVSAVPAGLLIWLLANIEFNGASLLFIISQFLDPFGKLFGLDGVIILAFILGLPANEVVVPIIIMVYMANDSLVGINDLAILKQLFVDNGWTITTALCFLVFTIFHWPCATTLLTIKKETNSWFWTLISAVLPMAIGLVLCFTINAFSKII